MKSIFYSLCSCCVLLCFSFQEAKAQANQSLSNLTPTAINVDLLPSFNGSNNLGSAAIGWKQLYITNAVFLGGSKFISFGNTLGLGVTAVGNNALASNTGGYANTGIGFFSLAVNTNGNENAAIGTRSLQANTTGSSNMAMGYFSLYSNRTGYANVAIGVRAMLSSTTGSNQIAIGDSAMFNTNGGPGLNTAIGSKTLYSNTTGGYNSAIGSNALYANTTGTYNTALGTFALYANSSGTANTGSGYHSLFLNTTGFDNTAYGTYSLAGNSTGANNTGLGMQALYTNSTGSNNTTLGAGSLLFNSTGGGNSATGTNALANNTTGNDNSAVGFQTLFSNTTGNYNTGTGEFALYSNFTGSGNTAVGYGADVTADGLTNATAIGYGAAVTASNQVWLGNSSVTSVKASAGFVIYSDGRFKKDVQANVPGLEFIKELRPVTYHYNIHGINNLIAKTKPGGKLAGLNSETSGQSAISNPAEEAAISAKEKILYTGFVAQEVEAAAKKINYDFSGLYKPQNEKDLYGLSYSDFVVPIIKGMQELSDSNDEKNAKINSLQDEVDSLKMRLQHLEDLVMGRSSGSVSLTDATLSQNMPNPFVGSTSIDYSVPQNFRRATLMVTDMSGRVIKSVSVNSPGRGNMHIDASGLSSGVYNYSLYIDDRLISTKQMVLTK